jgi:hypothetical protein
LQAFIGMAERGRMDVPVRVFNIADFEREYGPTTSGELADQVRAVLSQWRRPSLCLPHRGRRASRLHPADERGRRARADGDARDPGLEGNLIASRSTTRRRTPTAPST